MIQIESQCHSTESVNSANADCQAANVTFTCGSLHVAYELLLRLLENQDVSGIYLSAVAGIIMLQNFEISAQLCGILAKLTDIVFRLDVRARDVVIESHIIMSLFNPGTGT